MFAAIRRASSRGSKLVARLAVLAHHIGEPIVAICDRKGSLACFANRISRRSNVVTDDFVDGLTSRTDIEEGGRCDGHGNIIDNHCGAGLKSSLVPCQKRKLKRDENVTARSRRRTNFCAPI